MGLFDDREPSLPDFWSKFQSNQAPADVYLARDEFCFAFINIIRTISFVMDVVALKCPKCEGVHLSPQRSPTDRAHCPHCSHVDAWEAFTEVAFERRTTRRTRLPNPRPRPMAPPRRTRPEEAVPAQQSAPCPNPIPEPRAQPRSHLKADTDSVPADEQAKLLAFFHDEDARERTKSFDETPGPSHPDLENDWEAPHSKPRQRGGERFLLTVALHIGAALFIGAFVFIQLENSIASSRQAADAQEIELTSHQKAREMYERERALYTAQQALTQPTWTELLPYICESRRLLPEIRDYYERWPYAPFTNPDLSFVKRHEDESGCTIHLRLDAGKPWSRLVIMEKEGDAFKLDWEAFRLSHSSNLREAYGLLEDPVLTDRIEENEKKAAPYFGRITEAASQDRDID